MLLDRSSKKASLFSVQFTLSARHEESDKDFHTKWWRRISEPILIGWV